MQTPFSKGLSSNNPIIKIQVINKNTTPAGIYFVQSQQRKYKNNVNNKLKVNNNDTRMKSLASV